MPTPPKSLRMKLSDLWSWRGPLGRWPYLGWGLLLMGVKFNYDLALSSIFFNQPWLMGYYLHPPASMGPDDQAHTFYLMMMTLLGLPFVWPGVVLTLRRLQTVGLPRWLVVLFFAPVLNILFFLLLCALPDQLSAGTPGAPRRDTWLARHLPENPLASAIIAVVITALFGVFLTQLGTEILGQYAWGLFVGAPFVLGLISAAVHGARRPRSFRECVGVAMISLLLVGVLLLLLAYEGAICLLMALPLALPLTFVGAAVGYVLQRGDNAGPKLPPVISTMALAAPLLMIFEHAQPPEASLLVVRSSVEIAAPPEVVWHNVIEFNELPAPTERIFHTGIAYPIRAKIVGRGVGAIRTCIFSTGPFVEPIEVWDEPRLLRFGVTANPPPMAEWSPYPQLHPPHLDGYFVSEHGQFLLTALPNGHTLLEGTTWYRNHLWPETYWQIWSNYIIHRIHMRVLNFIKSESEKDADGRKDEG